MTLKIERTAKRQCTVFALSGRLEAGQITELTELFKGEDRSVVMDLRELRLADRDAVRFLARCEGHGIKLENCPAYIREWMEKEKF
jgi:hypothetical protein